MINARGSSPPQDTRFPVLHPRSFARSRADPMHVGLRCSRGAKSRGASANPIGFGHMRENPMIDVPPDTTYASGREKFQGETLEFMTAGSF
jgi:hypothetical protein